MARLWLLTPVHGRVELARIVLEQRARLLHELDGLGLEARQLVVGNDVNLATARELGFTVLERPNVLGLRVNDGLEWAFREGDATHVVYAGSDDWLLPEHLADLPAPGRARSSRWLSFVSPDGRRLASVPGSPPKGWVPWTLSRELLEPVGFRPVPDDAVRNLDTAIMAGFQVPRVEAFEYRAGDDPLRCVDFKSSSEQMTSWRTQVPARYARPNPFEKLATRYPADLCERMEELYSA